MATRVFHGPDRQAYYIHKLKIMMKKLFLLLLAACGALWLASCSEDTSEPGGSDHPKGYALIGFEQADLSAKGYQDSLSYTEAGATFANRYNSEYGTWDGFAVSKLTDLTTPGYENQYSAYAPAGATPGTQFAVGYYSTYDANPCVFAFPEGQTRNVLSAKICNSTYAYLTMRDGNEYARKYVDGDWMKLTVTGFDAAGEQTGTFDFYLADMRDGKNYLCDDWTHVSFMSLGRVNRVEFSMSCSDNDPDYGMNTPSYFCLDEIQIDDQP